MWQKNWPSGPKASHPRSSRGRSYWRTQMRPSRAIMIREMAGKTSATAHIGGRDLAVRFGPAGDRTQVEFVVQDPDLGLASVSQDDGRSPCVDPGERLEPGVQPEVRGFADSTADPVGQARQSPHESALGVVDFQDEGVRNGEILVTVVEGLLGRSARICIIQ